MMRSALDPVVQVGDTVLPLEDPGVSPSILIVLLHIGLAWMVLRARWEGIHQKVDIIAGRVEILAADCHGGRGRDTAGPDLPEDTLLLGFSVNRDHPSAPFLV